MKLRDLYHIMSSKKRVDFISTPSYQYIQSIENGHIFAIRQKVEHELNGTYELKFKVTKDTVDFVNSDETLYSSNGEIIGHKLDIDKNIGKIWTLPKKGDYKAVFNREQLLEIAKNVCHYGIYFRKRTFMDFVRTDKWIINCEGVVVNENKLPLSRKDTVISENFKFMVRSHTIRDIAKWFEGKELVFWFYNISGTQKTNVVVTSSAKEDSDKVCIFACAWERDDV